MKFKFHVYKPSLIGAQPHLSIYRDCLWLLLCCRDSCGQWRDSTAHKAENIYYLALMEQFANSYSSDLEIIFPILFF